MPLQHATTPVQHATTPVQQCKNVVAACKNAGAAQSDRAMGMTREPSLALPHTHDRCVSASAQTSPSTVQPYMLRRRSTPAPATARNSASPIVSSRAPSTPCAMRFAWSYFRVVPCVRTARATFMSYGTWTKQEYAYTRVQRRIVCAEWSQLSFGEWARLSAEQHGVARQSTAQHGMARHSVAQHSTAWRSTAKQSTARHCAAQQSKSQHGVARHGWMSARGPKPQVCGFSGNPKTRRGCGRCCAHVAPALRCLRQGGCVVHAS